jgi:aerobic carbon-monoxide dehydrogenase medium subunit
LQRGTASGLERKGARLRRRLASIAWLCSQGARLAPPTGQWQPAAATRHGSGERVKPPKFSYVRASGLAQVLELLEDHGQEAQILAGGQSLMPVLNMRLSQPKLLIDINRIDALKGIGFEAGQVRIGALARHVEVASSPIVHQYLPLLAEAMPHVAHLAVRNRGTFGGSIALADPAAELPACALALDARFVVASSQGRREIAAADFFKGIQATARRPNELLIETLIPARQNRIPVFLELARRHGDFAIAGLAFQLLLEEGIIADGRLAYFASEDRPTLALRALAVIKGRRLGPATAEAAVAALTEDLTPIDNAQASAKMRLHLQCVLTRRALAEARARSSGQTRIA